MQKKILYILPSFNKYGGTPKKTLDLISFSENECFVYVWSNAYSKEFKKDFVDSGATIYEGTYKRNFFKHISKLLNIIKTHDIEIVQSQFFFGELLAGIVKLRNPKIKLLIAFVGSMSPKGYKKHILNFIYKKADAFVYISNYVKREKTKIFPVLLKSNGHVIYNGTNKPESTSTINNDNTHINILCVSGLSKIKNVQVLLDAAIILVHKGYDNIQFLIAGDGPEKSSLETQIKKHNLTSNFKLLGYRKDIGDLYTKTRIFVHPCYIEGFGIAVAEAMIEEKPIIVADAGALPELIEDGKTGLLAPPFDAEQWANSIIKLINNPDLARTLAKNAKEHAQEKFSVKEFVRNYNNLYNTLIN